MRWLPALFLALALPLAGCFQMASTITVRPDGSAVVRDSVSLSGMAALALREGDGKGEGGIDKAQLRARAEALGPGVTLVALDEREDGFTAVYAVPDVAELRYTLPDLPLGEDSQDETIADEGLNLRFAFDPGRPAGLRITVPEDEPAPPSDDAPLTAAEQAEAEQGLRIARALLGDVRVRVVVDVAGDIVETDAAYVDGSTVTLFDLTFDALFDVVQENPALMTEAEPPFDRLRPLLAGREGVRLQGPGTVTVRFD